MEAISIKSIKEGGKKRERYHVFGLGLENFIGHIAPVVSSKSRFTFDYYSHPFHPRILQTVDQHGDTLCQLHNSPRREQA